MSAFENLFRSLSSAEEARKRAVWEKGHKIPGLDPRVWREDDYGYRLKYEDYGKRNAPYGWEIDHHPIPRAFGGWDSLNNIRPLHCLPNATLGGFLVNALRRP